MKKSILFFVIVFAVLTALGCVQAVHALDLDLINSVRQNEIISAENLSLDVNTTNATTATNNTISTTSTTNQVTYPNTTNTTLDTTTNTTHNTITYDDYIEDYTTEDAFPYSYSNYNTLDSVPSSTVDSTPQTTTVNPGYTTVSNSLSVGNILSILLIVVGFLLILLGIAILVRMKK